ncbi:transposase [Streptomyces sp. NPDC003635]
MGRGVPWRGLPSEYGPRQWVYGLFRRWQRDGTWPALLARLPSLMSRSLTVHQPTMSCR